MTDTRTITLTPQEVDRLRRLILDVLAFTTTPDPVLSGIEDKLYG